MSVIYLLIGQRKVAYPGQYAPEALAVADEYTQDDNPEYLLNEFTKYEKSNEFSSLKVIKVNVKEDFYKLLHPPEPEVSGEVIDELRLVER